MPMRLSALLPVALLLSSHSATAQRPVLTTDQWRADLRTMMEALPRVHRNLYHTTSKQAFDSAAAALDARIPTLARHQIILEMARIVALAGDGHTNIYPTRDPAIGFQTLPIAMYLFSDGLYIRSAHQSQASLAGARVVRIGDASPDEALRRVRDVVGRDNEMGARYFAPHLLAMPEVLHALGLAPGVDSARFEVEDASGSRRTVWLRPIGPAPLMAGDTDRSWRRRAAWVDARVGTAATDPLWLREAPDTTLWWFTTVPGTHTVYAQLNQIRDGAAATLEDFTTRLLGRLDSADVDRLVLDLRLDRGGNGELRAPLVRGLVKSRVNHRGGLYVLMGRATFSAAQFLLDDLDSFSDAVFVGEPSGSKGNAYGDSRQIKLPNSGVTVRASIYYWQHWSPSDTRQWTAPDLAAPLSFADYRANRDPALAAALEDRGAPTLSVIVRDLVAAGDTAGARVAVDRFRADLAHRYADAHPLLDDAALHFYRRHDLPRATWIFALAAAEYPDVLRAHTNLAAMYQESHRAAEERAVWERVLRLAPGNGEAIARLRQLDASQ